VLVDIGDSVKLEQPLIRLWVPEMHDELKQKESLVALSDAELDQARASVEAAEAAAETARAKISVAEAGVGRAEGEHHRWEAEHTRIKQLAESGSVTRKLLDETLNQFRAAEAAQREAAANVQSAQAGLKEAQVNVRKAQADAAAAAARLDVAKANLAHTKTLLGYTTITAPFDGAVTRRNVDTRHYVYPAGGSSQKPLLMVARTDKVRVFLDIPELESPLADVHDQATVRIQSLPGKEFNTVVARTSWSLEAANRSLRAEVDIDNPSGYLRPGVYAMVTVLLEQRENVLTLPATAIVREGNMAYCCVVHSGRIARTPVELGLRSGDEIEVVSGLDERQSVVLTRADTLVDGQQVEVSLPSK
jgi:RND family efflux transporter MFP subunit